MLTPIRKPTITRGRYAYHNMMMRRMITALAVAMSVVIVRSRSDEVASLPIATPGISCLSDAYAGLAFHAWWSVDTSRLHQFHVRWGTP